MQDKTILTYLFDNFDKSLHYFYPEIGLSVIFVAIIVLELLLAPSHKHKISWFLILSLCMIGFLIINLPAPNAPILYESLRLTSVSNFLKITLILCTIIFVLYLKTDTQPTAHYSHKGELYAFVTALLLGLFVMLMAENLILIYISLELVSISMYILISINNTKQSATAGIKYLIFGAVSSAVMLYGISLYYGLTGTLQLVPLPNQHFEIVSAIVFMLCAGVLFKLALFPFHTWVADVYQGGATAIVGWLSVIPKVAGLMLLFNILHLLYPQTSSLFSQPVLITKGLTIIVLVSITIGNLSALLQKSVKRMLAFSSVSHAGFLAILFIYDYESVIDIAIFYIMVYALMNLSIFLILDYLNTQLKTDNFNALKGLGFKLPYISILLVMVLMSLAGLPPSLGFTSKFLIFSQVFNSYQQTHDIWFLVILIVALVNTAVALFYYLKIPYYLYFKKNENEVILSLSYTKMALYSLLVLPLILLFFAPQLLINLINFSIR